MHLTELQKLLRVWILEMTTAADSGHPTSSLSAVELMSTLLFGRDADEDAFFRYDINNPESVDNDRLIFSKGHASPLYYALWATADAVSPEDLMTYRKFDSVLEGHPTRRFALTEVPTGSLGQGLSVGVGEALALRQSCAISPESCRRVPNVFVLLGDSEMAEGQVWEAMAIASHYTLSHLIAIVDVNRLGQCGETMLGWDTETYRRRAEAFGWHAIVVDGHDTDAVTAAYAEALAFRQAPIMIIARTVKGKGVSFLEDADGWHGRVLSPEQLQDALAEIGAVDRDVRGTLARSKSEIQSASWRTKSETDAEYALPTYKSGEMVASRQAYGDALTACATADSRIVALDAETGNSTRADAMKQAVPERFYEMYIAEQNMVSAAVGMARRGYHPFVSTFAAFLTRAADQIRMAQYAGTDVTFVGSHAGVSIGQDGGSQMGLEDIALFAALGESTIFYPSDAVATAALTALAADTSGITYIRTTRAALPVIHDAATAFVVGGSQTLRVTADDVATVVAAGITVHEALAAADILAKEGVAVRVIDAYSVRPLDTGTIRAAAQTRRIIVVEDHHEVGGLGSAVYAALAGTETAIRHLCVRHTPRSATPAELLAYEEIDAAAIAAAVRSMI